MPAQPNRNNWWLTDTYSLVYGSLIAIRVPVSFGSPGFGLLGSGDTSGSYVFFTSTAWRSTNNFESNWFLTSFNDQGWPYASQKGPNSQLTSPWNTNFQNISPEARWIWPNTNVDIAAYFRFRKIKILYIFSLKFILSSINYNSTSCVKK